MAAKIDNPKAFLPEPNSPLWRHSPRKNSEQTVKWLPLTDRIIDGFQIGIDSDGQWVGETAEGVERFSPHEPHIALLPVLQKGRTAATEIISDALASKELSLTFAEVFPFCEIIVEGLKAHGYWAEMALAALEEGETLNELYEGPLSELSEDKKQTTQSVRHRAAQLLSQIRRAKSSWGEEKGSGTFFLSRKGMR